MLRTASFHLSPTTTPTPTKRSVMALLASFGALSTVDAWGIARPPLGFSPLRSPSVGVKRSSDLTYLTMLEGRGRDGAGDQFPTWQTHFEQLLLQPHKLEALKSQLMEQGGCILSAGPSVLSELANYFNQHAQIQSSRSITIPADSDISKLCVAVANQLSGERYHHCKIHLTQWDSGVPAQPWHQDSPDDQMVWVLTASGEPTWWLEPEASDRYCNLDDDNEFVGATYECDLPKSGTDKRDIIKRAPFGKFIVFFGRQEVQGGIKHALVHKSPGTMEAPDGRATVRIAFSVNA